MDYKFKIKAIIIFERIADKPFEIKTLEDLYLYFYCVRMVNIENYTDSFEQFLDWCDENPDEITNFTEQFSKYNKRQDNMTNQSKKK